MSSATGPAISKAVPPVLCVDLDGTLIAGDLLWECVLALLKQAPWTALLIPVWALRGRSVLKARLAERVHINPALLPYRQEVLAAVEDMRRMGPLRVVLTTASHERIAAPVSQHLGIFDEVIATNDGSNLKGRLKAERLQQRFGNDFTYAGDSRADLHVWRLARKAIVVGSDRMRAEASQVTDVERFIATPRSGLRDIIQALRPHHWSKNVLLLLPLLLSHNMNLMAWARTAIGMLLFCSAASGVYVLNDLFDLASDRKHPWKSKRPFASGLLSIPVGLALATALLALAAIGGVLLVNRAFALAVLVYLTLSIAYSIHLKKRVLVDVFVLTSFYGMRIVTGALITGTLLSHWFLAFSMFFFFSLAMAKRFSELVHARELVENGNSGRGYSADDMHLLSQAGIASAFASVIVFSFYVQSPSTMALYPHPEPLMMISPVLLYWLIRVWLKAHRGQLDEDPITLAMHDKVSYMVGLAAVAFIAMSILWR